MENEYRVVPKKGRGKKQQGSESSRLLSTLYNQGLRPQDLDADSRHFLESSPEAVKVKALSHLLDRRQHGAIHNPSAFLTIALNNASFDPSPVNIAHSATGKAEFSSAFCTSANHLLSILAKEGLTAADIDPDCQAYLARARPAVQTQALQDFLEAWRFGRIKNASAYLTDLLTRASKNPVWSDQDVLPFMDVPPNVNPQPRKVAVPIASPHEYVPADTTGIGFLAAKLKVDSIPSAGSTDFGRDGLYSKSWPAVGATNERSCPASPKQKPVPKSKVHDAILRYFAKQFIPMGKDDLKVLQLADLETILQVQGESGVFSAIDAADEAAKMMPLYDISDEAGQTELLLKELEYVAQSIVDKLEQSGQLPANDTAV
ncbi:hypothetical protein ABBQ32_010720 [Trebouxia sp. C0010 RCD-2024]